MDINNLMQMANELQQKISSAQTEARKLQITGEAGAGLVRVVMNGQHEVVELKIDPAVFKGEADWPLVEDLVRAAVNAATTKVAAELKGRLGGMAQEFGVDMSMFGGPGGPPK